MAPWAGLRLNLVGRILAHLPCLAHRAAFAAVCYNWRAVAAPAQLPPQIPWLLLPSAAAQEPVFFCIRCGNTHRAFLPDHVRTARCCGSHPGGWLVLALQPQPQKEQDGESALQPQPQQEQNGDFVLQPQPQRGGGYALHNLHTGESLAVRDFLEAADCIGEVGMIVLGAALSAAATADFLAVVLTKCPSPIAFWLPGMGHLSPPTPFEPYERPAWRDMLPGGGGKIADVIYYAGHGLEGFHVLTDAEEVLVYVPELALDGVLTTRLVTYSFPDHHVTWEPLPWYTISRYLLNFFGELVMVVRYVSITEEDEELVEGDEGTRWIHAFQLTWEEQAGNHGDRQAQWERVWFPDNVVVMLGRCSSMAFVSPAVALDSLYFLDDANSFDDVMAWLKEWQPFPCTDMGRCTVQHEPEQVEPVFPMRPPSEFSPAAWFFH